ncbi:alkaline phosphatase [Leptolyngbya sp. Heron Island J]|uniref:bifunctional metallophosphatase/5'-nucleotidase n=1 Tax=Leptolyngbya sp. Heron Island J TaxID=1385935 RepID=UPI0003B96855|nr:5'-nucleotidase C-terminal domain-containing protein [Leptolyngbya sp. Heron Island J]ESA32140.1 alkaline phosphatase [Leptolyngbya sp. Heron Island J]
MKRFGVIGRIATMAATVSLVSLAGNNAAQAFSLTILHNNDGESDLLPGEDGFGGAAQFVGEINNIRNTATTDDVLLLSSGDNFLAGPEFNASLTDGVFYDAIALSNAGYDAIILGNHDFDFGPDILADFIGEVDASIPFLSANLDFSAEAALQDLVAAGRIAKSTVVTKGGEQIGIVGATTPNLPFISSPDGVVVGQDVQAAVQGEIDALTAAGVQNIIFVSHLQGVDEDQALIAQLSGVDVAIAGGGDELLDSGDTSNLIPGDTPDGPYPIFVTDANGNEVPVVTTPGQYSYVGQLVVEFNNGVATVIDPGTASDPVAIDGDFIDAATQAAVADPVQASLDALESNVIAQSEVNLNGERNSIRGEATNLGNLIADSFLWQANALAADFGLGEVDIALGNGGGIRNDSIIPAGDFTEADTFDILPFTNFLSVFEAIEADNLKDILENAVSRMELDPATGETAPTGDGTGRFAQIAGFSFEYNPTLTAIEIDVDGNITTSGERVINVTLDDGTVLIQDGQVLPDAPDISLAIVDFLARGGDQYPFGDAAFTNLGVSYQQALANYITDELGGVISAADYPEGGGGRTVVTDALPVVSPVDEPPIVNPPDSESVPEPGVVVGLVGLGLLGARRLKRYA